MTRRRLVLAAAAAGSETETRARLVAGERIAAAVQSEYQRRYADLADTIRPLLMALADGGAVDAATQQQARIEYQRLRTLFDQSAAFDHILLRGLRPVIDDAQDRGVAVSVTVAGTLPPIGDSGARRLTQVIARALTTTADLSSARITVSGDASALTLSVICRGVHHAESITEQAAGGDNQLTVVVFDDTVWITVRHRIAEGAPQYALAGHVT